MIIKKMTASYGCLNGDTLELKDGLNIVNAPNESGKSTWCSFIRTMLYGLNSSERDKIGFLSEKTKYHPWHGGEMAGTMDINAQGDNITLQRSNLGKAAMRNFSAVYTGTEIPVDGLNSENCGEAVCKMSRAVFERSVFIKESDVRIFQTSELEKRIAAIVSSGDEQFSYTDADAKLREWTRKRKYNSSGAIPTNQNKLQENAETLERIQKDADESARLRLEIERLEEEKELLLRETSAHEALEKLDTLAGVKKAYEDMLEAKKAEADAADALKKYGSVDDGIIDSVRAELAALDSVYEMTENAEKAEMTAQNEKNAAEEKKNASVFARLTPDEAAKKAADAKTLMENANKSRKNAIVITVITIILALAFAFAGVYTYLMSELQPYISAIFLALCVISIVVCVLVNVSSGKKKKLFSTALAEFGIADFESFYRLSDEYSRLYREYEAAESKLASETEDAADAKNRQEKRISALLEKAREISPSISEVGEIMPCMDEVTADRKSYAQASAKAAAAEGLYGALAKNAPQEDIKAPDISPRFKKSQTAALLSECIANIEKRQAAFHMALGRMRAMGDPLVIESDNKVISEKLEQLGRQYDALLLAQEMLKQADTEIQTRFAPVLGKEAGNIFREITGGKYDMLAFDRTLDAAAQAHGDSISHNVLSLSSGTEDQVYLALRLAISVLCCKGDDCSPIILDDALICFDDKRMANALDYLKKLSETRQVILFTCQKREAEYFKDDESVTKLELVR